MEATGKASDRREANHCGCAGVADGRVHGVVQAVHGPAVGPEQKVAVDGEGEGRGVVTELLLHVGQGLAGFDRGDRIIIDDHS